MVMVRVRSVVGYGLAIVLPLCALLFEVALQPASFAVPFFVFTFAVGFVAVYGGSGPGLVALVFSALIGNILLYEPMGALSFGRNGVLSTLVFLGFGGVAVVLVGRYRGAISNLRRDRDDRSLLLEVSNALERSFDVQATLASVARLAVPRLADWCCVFTVAEHRPTLVAIAHRDPEKVSALEDYLARYPEALRDSIGKVIQSGQPVYQLRITDRTFRRAAGEDGARLAELRRLGFRSYICVPVMRDGRVGGVLCAATAESDRELTSDDVELLAILADRVGVACGRAELYTEAQLQKTRAEQASRTKDQFLAMLGHELRNPLSPIAIALALMKERDPDAFEKERTIIERQVRQLTRLVDDLLDIGRIVAGRVELRADPVDLADVVARSIETTEPLIDERGHSVFVKVPLGLRVSGDETRLVQVVANLITNAAKYTNAGGHIDIIGDRANGHVILRVRDTGMGISPEVLPHIFDMFVQESQALDRARGGLGLGLTIARNIVQRLGGDISATSEVGKGTEFVIRMPALVGEQPASVVEAVPAGVSRPVLVVDDNRDALDLLADGLERRGIPTVRAADGPSALALATDVHPHVALLDIGLPVMDGYELARRLHEIDATMQLVAVTGYGQPGDAERAAQAGFVAHLVKPVTLDLVHSTVEKLVSTN